MNVEREMFKTTKDTSDHRYGFDKHLKYTGQLLSHVLTTYDVMIL